MKFSLVLATYNRKSELELFIKSLLNQHYKFFELIIVDQNTNNLIDDLILNYSKSIEIKHFKSNKLGLSYNRNIGLKYAIGDIIAFPDDDCEYPKTLLNEVYTQFILNKNIDIITGSTFDKNTKLAYLKSPIHSVLVNYRNIFSTAISFTIFVKNYNKYKLTFDEKLGVGADFGSSEETDFLVQFLQQNVKMLYLPNIIVFHPVTNFQETNSRIFNYAKGFGAFHRKYFFKHNFIYAFRFIFFIFINLFRILTFQDLKKNFTSLKGKITGFVNYY
jgi:glycosyltransferase involved in cell wall biosynthesis